MSYCSFRRFEYGERSSEQIFNFVSTILASCLRETIVTATTFEEDTYGWTFDVSANFGSDDALHIGRIVSGKGTTPSIARAFLSIDLDNYIPSVTSYPVHALLHLDVELFQSDTGLPPPRLLIRRANASFNEATLTWSNAPTAASSPGQVEFTVSGTGPVSVNVTTLVQECWNSGAMCFWVISAVNEIDYTNSHIIVASTESATASDRPRLELEYAP